MCNHKKQHTTGWRCKRSVSPGKGCIYDYDVIINMSPKCKTKLALIINITKKNYDYYVVCCFLITKNKT